MNEVALIKDKPIDFEKKAVEYLDAMGMTRQLNDSQKKLFVELASAYQLNPFKREIYPIVYRNKNGGNDISLVTGYEVYIQRANQSGLLDGWTWETDGDVKYKTELRTTKEGKNYQTKTIDKDTSNLKATVTIYRKDWKHPFMHSITIDEFSGDSGIWLQSPKFMLKKTCASQAFRLCFSKELSGIPYTTEETSTFRNDIPEYEVIPMTPVSTPKAITPSSEPVEVEPEPVVEKEADPHYPFDSETYELRSGLLSTLDDMFRKNYVTESKYAQYIKKINDETTQKSLLKYFERQINLIQKLFSLKEAGILDQDVSARIYKSILTAKSEQLKSIELEFEDMGAAA